MRACEHGRSPRAGLDGENGVTPCSHTGKPLLFGFNTFEWIADVNTIT